MIFSALRLSAINELFFAWCDEAICFQRLAFAEAPLETVRAAALSSRGTRNVAASPRTCNTSGRRRFDLNPDSSSATVTLFLSAEAWAFTESEPATSRTGGFASIELRFWRCKEHRQPLLTAHEAYSKLACGACRSAKRNPCPKGQAEGGGSGDNCVR